MEIKRCNKVEVLETLPQEELLIAYKDPDCQYYSSVFSHVSVSNFEPSSERLLLELATANQEISEIEAISHYTAIIKSRKKIGENLYLLSKLADGSRFVDVIYDATQKREIISPIYSSKQNAFDMRLEVEKGKQEGIVIFSLFVSPSQEVDFSPGNYLQSDVLFASIDVTTGTVTSPFYSYFYQTLGELKTGDLKEEFASAYTKLIEKVNDQYQAFQKQYAKH